jgi:hypothetical protein
LEGKKVSVKIWQILEGPIEVDDIPDTEHPENATHFCVCKAEVNGVMEDMNIWFESFDDAYTWQIYFQKYIEPLELEGS